LQRVTTEGSYPERACIETGRPKKAVVEDEETIEVYPHDGAIAMRQVHQKTSVKDE
jgi:hypothetical protein